MKRLLQLHNVSSMALLLAAMLFCVISSHATIPSSIAGTYTVSGPESSIGNVTIQNGGTLTITGSSAIATINGSVTVMPGGKLIIQSSATVKMAANTRILVKSTTSSSINSGYLHMDNGHITTAAANIFWSGLETSIGTGIWPTEALIEIENKSIIENATVAYRNYDSGNPNINATSGGLMFALNSTFRNNIRHLDIHNSFGNGVPTDPVTLSNLNLGAIFQRCKFIDSTNFTPSTAPVDMVYLNNCSNVTFYSCWFYNYTGYAINCINAVNAGFFLQSYPGSLGSPRCLVNGFKNGVMATNSLQTDRVCLIANTDFSNSLYSINMSGCFNPYILNCSFIWPDYDPSQDRAGIYLNNCTGYKVEGNHGYSHPIMGAPFAVARNSGTAYNEIYRNAPTNNELGIQSLGINRDVSGSTGLKILCNNLSTDEFSGISIMHDPAVFPTPPQGIANQQCTYTTVYTPYPISAITSAGNQFFHNASMWDFYVDAGTNNLSQLTYRYNPSVTTEQPIYTNLLTANVLTTPYGNSCPIHTSSTIIPPYPYSLLLKNNTAVEHQIKAVISDAPGAADTAYDSATVAALDPLYALHAQYIDSIITYYQYMAYSDTTGRNAAYKDSIILVYQQITVGYEYQIYLASAYADKGDYGSALTVLRGITTNYTLTNEEKTYISNLEDMFTVRQWLYQNDGNWSSIPSSLSELVYKHEGDDPMFAGAMARAILAQYEGATYDPYYIVPPAPVKTASMMVQIPMTDKIYPNPTAGHTTVTWTNGDAVLSLYNTVGRKVYQMSIKPGINDMDITRLPAGIYIAQIQIAGKQVYQQKVMKE